MLKFLTPHQPLLRRLQKLDSYFRAVSQLIVKLDKEPYTQFLHNINFKEVNDQS